MSVCVFTYMYHSEMIRGEIANIIRSMERITGLCPFMFHRLYQHVNCCTTDIDLNLHPKWLLQTTGKTQASFRDAIDWSYNRLAMPSCHRISLNCNKLPVYEIWNNEPALLVFLQLAQIWNIISPLFLHFIFSFQQG